MAETTIPTKGQTAKAIADACHVLTGGDGVMRYENDILWAVATRMVEEGGSFVKLLGDIYFRADGANQLKILETWDNYFLDYSS